MRLDDVEMEVVTEDGTFRMTLGRLRVTPDLIERIGRQASPPQDREVVFLGPTIVTFPRALLERDKKRRDLIEEARRMYEANPLKYFMPQSQTVLDFLNWKAENLSGTLKVLHAGVGTGKSVAGCIDVLLDIIPCDPTWPVFRHFGVKYRPYRGPKENGGVAIVSYEMKNHQNTLWPQVLRRWCPREYIEPFLTGARTIPWRLSPKIEIAGTPVFFLVSSQRDTAFVSQALDIIWWDEQSTEDKFNNANARVLRRGGRHVMTMTPHHIAGRPDTGAGSYVDRIRKGEMTAGLKVRFFQMSLDEVVEWVMPKSDKQRLIMEWVEEPMRSSNLKKLAEGRAIVYGEFHEASQRVFDMWDRSLHVIPPFDVPKWWTFWRYHDHGRRQPNAAILVAVNEEGDYFIIREYYSLGKEIAENARGIIEDMTGNRIVDVPGGWREEQPVSYDVMGTISDIRSLNKRLDNATHTIGDEYAMNGLVLLPGSVLPVAELIPMAAELLMPDNNKTHIVHKRPPAPRLYVFDTCQNFIREIENWRYRKRRQHMSPETMERPVDEDDHLMRCLLELAAHRPQFVPRNRPADDDEVAVVASNYYSVAGY